MYGRIQDKNIWRVYAATLSLGVAYGMALSLLALFLDQRGFAKRDIGTLAAWFAAGIVAGSIPIGGIVRRLSAKRTLVAALAGYAVAVVAFPFLDSYLAIALLRFVDGVCSVGIWVSFETILLLRAGPGDKALVTSLYAVAMAIGYIVGPALARLLATALPLSAAFVVAGVLSLCTAAYVFARLEPDPRPVPQPGEVSGTTRRAAVLRRVKTSCFATFAYGYFQSSVVLFLPLYLVADKAIAREQTIVIPAFFAAGMLLFAHVAGRLGDRFGHLAVMRWLAAAGTSMIVGFVFLESYAMMCAAVFVAGATLASISPVSLALQGVVVSEVDYPRATAVYNTFYALGMLLGPPVSSVLFEAWGGAVMLYHLASLWVLFIVFAAVFARDDPAARPQRTPLGAMGAVE